MAQMGECHMVETMAYTGAVPWHGLGTYVGDEAVDGATMLKLAGLDWTVAAMPLFTCSAPKEEGGKLVRVHGHRAIVRSTDQHILGVVTKQYKPLQNSQAFAVLDNLVSDGSMRYHTAGALQDGQRVWALGKIGSFEVVPGDRTDNYIMIYTGHDGGTATRVLWTQVRVVCNNTARAALSSGRGEGLSVRHTSNQDTRLSTAGRVLGLAQENLEKSAEFLRRSAASKLTEERWVKLASELVPDPESGSAARAQAKREELTRLLFRGRGQQLPGVEGTMYAARNAVTEYVNYQRQARGDEDEAQGRRFDSSLWGSGASMVAKADELLLEMMDASTGDLEPSTPIDAVDLMDSLN